MSETQINVVPICVGGALLFGLVCGGLITRKHYRSEAIQRGHAAYFITDTNTGETEWRWK